MIQSYEALIIGLVLSLWSIAGLISGRVTFCVIVKCWELSRQRNAAGYWAVVLGALAFGGWGLVEAFR